MFDNYLSLTHASQLSGLSVWTLKRLIDQGKLAGARSLRGDRMVEKADLERLMREKESGHDQ